MKYLTRDNLIVLALILMVSDTIFSWLKPTEPKIDLETEIRLHDIEQEKDLLQKEINLKEVTIKRFENEFEKIKNDPTIDTATISELNSFFTNYIAKRR